MDLDSEVQMVIKELKDNIDPERKKMSKGYYPSSIEVLGVKVPNQRSVMNSLKRRLKGRTPEEFLEISRSLVDTGIFECQQVAYELLSKNRNALDLVGAQELKDLEKGLDNWVSVDTFSAYLLGVAWREGRIPDKDIIDRTRSEDKWIRRSALVSTISLNQKARGGTGDVDRTLMVCNLLASDGEEMVAKALSWSLRELSKVEKGPVIEFMEFNDDVIPSRVRREVWKKLRTGKKNG